MNIKQFSQVVGISAYTLRYYEKIGLLADITRNSSGHRSYSNNDIEWAQFIVRLKETGMELVKIKEYAELRAQGESTLKQRQVMLEQHRSQLKQAIEAQNQHLLALDKKIGFYQQLRSDEA